jgi:ABC-type multidrug transport system fused ATPase/permease subunit
MSTPRILKGKRRMMLGRLIGIGFAQAGATIATASLVQFAFDRWVTPGSPGMGQSGLIVLVGLLAAAGTTAWLRLRERVEAERLGQSYAYAVRIALYDRLGSLAPRTLQRRSRGGNLLRFIGDLTALRQWVSLGLARISVATVTTVVAVTAMAFINRALAGAVAVILVFGGCTAYFSGRTMQDAVRESRRRRARLAANVNEKLSSMPVVQVFDQVERERTRLARQSRRLRDAMIGRARIVGRLRAVTEATSGVAAAAVLMLGAYEVSQGRATAGTVVAAMTVLGMLVPALRDLGRIHEYWHAYRVGLDKIRSFMNTPALVDALPDAAPLPVVDGAIELRDISVDGTLDRLNASAPAGSVVAIVGPNGSGKSTLLNLAARLIDPDQGQVLIDGNDLAQHRLASVRQSIGMVSPDLPLMRGSVERNLRYRCRDASDEELRRVCELCGVDAVIAELPEGERTRVTEGGMNLSLGQRQRVALARALLGDPKILLLDEADANLDPSSVALLDRVLRSYQGTVLFVTHRLERVAGADLVWYVDEGRVMQAGPPSQLLNEEGPTRHAFRRPLTLAA